LASTLSVLMRARLIARNCLACASTTSATCGSRMRAIANALPVASSTTRSVGATLRVNSSSCSGVVAIRPPSARGRRRRSRPGRSRDARPTRSTCPPPTSQLDTTTREDGGQERHLRIRARSAPGQVAGAARYTSGLTAIRVRPARPRSPRAPIPEHPALRRRGRSPFAAAPTRILMPVHHVRGLDSRECGLSDCRHKVPRATDRQRTRTPTRRGMCTQRACFVTLLGAYWCTAPRTSCDCDVCHLALNRGGLERPRHLAAIGSECICR
jgi:hypothetical protein